MLLKYRDPQFWKKFQAKHWLPRAPVVIRQPFKTPLFSEDALLQALQAYETGLQDGDLRSTCLVSVGDKETAPRRPLRQLFRQPSETLTELERNCARVFAKKRFGLMVTQFQTVHPAIWNPITAFIQDAQGVIDYPVPRAFLDLFYGNYKSGFTGVHKDTQEIFAFVVRGEKRMLAWPFDYFLSRAEGLSPATKYFHMRLDVDHRKFRKDAIVLEASPGDVIYWPSDHWHVADSDPGFSGMISLGLFRPEITLTPRPATAVNSAEAARQFRWRTGFGFELGGPFAQKANPLPKGETSVVKNPSSLLLWKPLPDNRLLVSTNGQSLTVPYSESLVKLIEEIFSGVPVTVSPSKKSASVAVTETNWTKQCKLVTRKRISRRDPASQLVDWLARVNAAKFVIGAQKAPEF